METKTLLMAHKWPQNEHSERSAPDRYDAKKQSRARRRSLWNLYIAMILCTGLTMFTALIVPYQIELADPRHFSNDLHTLFITGITIAGTLISVFVTNAVRDRWLQIIDSRVEHFDDHQTLTRLNKIWRSNLGLLQVHERIRYISTWPNQVLYVQTALIATAIIAATVASVSTVVKPYFPQIPDGGQNVCSLPIDHNLSRSDRSIWASMGYIWDFSQNESYWVATSNTVCPASYSLTLMENINPDSPEQYAYALNGVAVSPTAIGAPEVLYSDNLYVSDPSGTELTALKNSTARYQSDLLAVSQCGPVLAKAPVKCRYGGSFNLKKYSWSATSDNQMCTAHSQNHPPRGGSTAASFCPHGTPGAGTVLFASRGWDAVLVAMAMGDERWLNQNEATLAYKRFSYVVTCDVDYQSSLAWRNLTFHVKHPYSENTPFPLYLTGGETCDPRSNATLGPTYAATAASGLYWPLSHNALDSGWAQSIISPAINDSGVLDNPTGKHWASRDIRTRGWAFPDSENGLEDVLGLAGAMVMSKILISNPSFLPEPSVSLMNVSGSQVISVIRVGSGHRFAYVYIIPSSLILLFTVWLLLQTPGAATEFRSSHLPDLIELAQKRKEASLEEKISHE